MFDAASKKIIEEKEENNKMKRAGLLMLMFVVVILSGTVVAGPDNFGIPVYPGATYDETTSKAVKQMMNSEAACYRTNDGVQKVAAFYKRQEGLKSFVADEKNAMFKKGKIDITVQTPWMDMKTGKMNSDTLISIVKNP